MIEGLWKMIKIYCGNNHEKLVPLEPREGPLSLFYACPKYYEDNREELEKKCTNRINLNDYDALVNHLDKILSEAIMNNEQLDLTGYKWKNKGVTYEVFEHNKHIKIKIYSQKSIGKYNLR